MKRLGLNESIERKLESDTKFNLTDNDLNKCLDETREIIENLYGKEFVEDNDTNPTITFVNLNRNKLGHCITTLSRNTDYIATKIEISKTLKQYPKDIAMNTIIHEYLHSLKCCLTCNHSGKWKEIANKINSSTDYNIKAEADDEDSKYFKQMWDQKHKTVYYVICNHCGHKCKYYTAKVRIIQHPEWFYHSCSDGTKGSFRVEIEKRK